MKKSFIAYVLGGFACTVIILLGFSISMAASASLARTSNFAIERAAFGFDGFISGADTFFTILLVLSYVLFNAVYRKRLNQTPQKYLIKHIIAFLVAILVVELTLPFSNDIEIVSSFSRLSYIFLGVAVYLQATYNKKTDTIDRVFGLFGISALSAIFLQLILHLFGGFPFSFINELKFILLLFLSSFFTYLASYITYTSFRTPYV